MKVPITARSFQSGFTLIETLVALALLSLMTIFATGAIATMSRTKQVEARIAVRSNMEAVERHLTQTLSDMRTLFAVGTDQGTQLAFSGESGSVSFVGLLSDRLERGGLYSLHYGVTENGVFALEYQLYRPLHEFKTGQSENLLSGVENVSFNYFGSTMDGDSARWSNQWHLKDTLPRAISVEFKLKGESLMKRHAFVVMISGGG
jgi:type II secretion system protein J